MICHELRGTLEQFIVDSIKVGLGFGNCALGSYCSVVTRVNHSIVSYAQMPNYQWPITKATFFDLAVYQGKADAYWGRETHFCWIVLDRKLLTGYVYPSFYL